MQQNTVPAPPKKPRGVGRVPSKGKKPLLSTSPPNLKKASGSSNASSNGKKLLLGNSPPKLGLPKLNANNQIPNANSRANSLKMLKAV